MIRIVTDSGANLPTSVVRQFDLAVVPLYVNIGDETYREGEDVSSEQFYELLQTGDVMPTTSQPSPQDFIDVYAPIVDAGDEIISIHLSSELSGTYNSAMQATASLEGAPIAVVDTRLASVAEALLVVAAARAVQAGHSRGKVTALLEYLQRRTSLLFVLDTLEYLKRGGRIGGARAFIGTMLRIKPILQIQDGIVQPLDRVRSRQRALDRLTEVVHDRHAGQAVWVGVAHAEARDEAESLMATSRQQLDVAYELTSTIGPVVGTHAGPGTVGIAVMPAPEIDGEPI